MNISSAIKSVFNQNSRRAVPSGGGDAFVSIPRERSVYCLDCDTISVAQVRVNAGRCGVCGGEAVVTVSDLFSPSEAAMSGREPTQAGRLVAQQPSFAFAYRAS